MIASTLTAALLGTLASTSPLSAYDTAEIQAPHAWSIGVIDPLRVVVAEGLELETQPLLFFVAPNAVARVAHWQQGEVSLTGAYGLSVPTPAMRLLQGYLFPTWEMSSRRIGWFVVPSVGAVASYGLSHESVTTLRLDAAVGLALTHNDATELDSVPPLDLLLAPALTGYRLHAGLEYDRPLVSWLRGRVQGDLYRTGATSASPWVVSAALGLDLAIGSASRLGLGLRFWNSDAHAIDLKTHAHYRSNELWPSVDFVWAG
jgi:hypothetical protein